MITLQQLVGRTVTRIRETNGCMTVEFDGGWHLIGTAAMVGTCHVMSDGKLIPWNELEDTM